LRRQSRGASPRRLWMPGRTRRRAPVYLGARASDAGRGSSEVPRARRLTDRARCVRSSARHKDGVLPAIAIVSNAARCALLAADHCEDLGDRSHRLRKNEGAATRADSQLLAPPDGEMVGFNAVAKKNEGV